MHNQTTANFTKLNPLSEMIPLRTPLSVAISPNNICNIQCKYCYHGSKKKQEDIRNKTYVPTMISDDCFEQIVSQLEEFGEPIKQITLIGSGEPLVNQNLPDMIHTLKARVAERVKISSNALLQHGISYFQYLHPFSQRSMESAHPYPVREHATLSNRPAPPLLHLYDLEEFDAPGKLSGRCTRNRSGKVEHS